MKRNVGQNNHHILRRLLERSLKEQLDKIDKNFRYNFTKENPKFSFTVEVSAYEFETCVMEEEIGRLKARIRELEEQLSEYIDES